MIDRWIDLFLRFDLLMGGFSHLLVLVSIVLVASVTAAYLSARFKKRAEEDLRNHHVFRISTVAFALLFATLLWLSESGTGDCCAFLGSLHPSEAFDILYQLSLVVVLLLSSVSLPYCVISAVVRKSISRRIANLDDVAFALLWLVQFILIWTYAMGHAEVNWIRGYRGVWLSAAVLWGLPLISGLKVAAATWRHLAFAGASQIASLSLPLLARAPMGRERSLQWLLAIVILHLAWLSQLLWRLPLKGDNPGSDGQVENQELGG